MKAFTLLLIIALTVLPMAGQAIPEGYRIQYQQQFTGSKPLAGFSFSNPNDWKIAREKGVARLEAVETGFSCPLLGQPATMAILNERIYGDFILEAEVSFSTSIPFERDFFILFGMKDTTRYYMLRLSSLIENQGFYIVNRKPLQLLKIMEEGRGLSPEQSFNIRLERDIILRTIKLYAGNLKSPLLEAEDWNLVMGYIGFGAFSPGVRFGKIKIWSQTSIPEQAAPLFQNN